MINNFDCNNFRIDACGYTIIVINTSSTSSATHRNIIIIDKSKHLTNIADINANYNIIAIFPKTHYFYSY